MRNIFQYIQLYKQHIPRMKSIEKLPDDPIVKTCLWINKQAYSDQPESVAPNGYVLLREWCREGGVVYGIPGVSAVLGFRGIFTPDVSTISHCLSVLERDFPDERDTLTLATALGTQFPELVLTGHSFGGARANHLARNLDSRPRTILFNPAQGLDPGYPERVGKHPHIHTFHVVGDIVSCIAGLENPEGVHRIMPKNLSVHALSTFND